MHGGAKKSFFQEKTILKWRWGVKGDVVPSAIVIMDSILLENTV